MPRRPTSAQLQTMERIRLGLAPHPNAPHAVRDVAVFESAVRGDVVLCHRTCRLPDRPLVALVEMFRVMADGTVTQH